MKSFIRRSKLAENFNAGVGNGTSKAPGPRPGNRSRNGANRREGQNEPMQRARRVLRG
jgi:hypothetical protein